METATATDPSTGVNSTSTAPAATEDIPGSATDPSIPTTTSSSTSPVDPTEDVATDATHTSDGTTTTTTTTTTATSTTTTGDDSTSDDSTTTTTGAGTSTSSTGDDSTTGDTTTTSGTTEPGTTTTTTTDSTTSDGSSSSTTGMVEMCIQGEQIDCYEGPPGTVDVGICRSGHRNCNNGVYSEECYSQRVPLAEQCNGLDEDCDGEPEPMHGPKVKIGTGKFPKLIARGDHFVAAWVDPFNKIILQRLSTTGAPIGAAVPLIINGAIHDLDLASYAGGVALGWVRTDVMYDGQVSFVRTFDDELAPLSAEQRLGSQIVTGVDDTNLEIEGVGGGSSSFIALEVKLEGFKTVVRYAFLPQDGNYAPMTELAADIDGNPANSFPLLAPTDYGAVGIYHGGLPGGTMRGFGPAGNALWSTQLPAGRAAHVAYTGDDLTVIIGTFNWIGARYSASDGTQLAVLPKVSGLYGGESSRQLSGVYANGNHHIYGCMKTSFTHSRFTKPGAFVPYEAAQAAFGACTPNQAQAAVAAVNGSIGVLQVSGLDLFFHPQLCP
ncbi:hypothetical protein [Nannocystis radixulma]|uniref:Myxococcus cysteine-rich repeat-containing protein n=1 Tax=Nannocystis radixulma TaxID=2995305 RepID=A0ABT5AXT5_9BACT|nr:hypothetical protein [Nannocystis radixulma]MDC0666650.1 hypothetical protein [Nannocystis radixulma]